VPERCTRVSSSATGQFKYDFDGILINIELVRLNDIQECPVYISLKQDAGEETVKKWSELVRELIIGPLTRISLDIGTALPKKVVLFSSQKIPGMPEYDMLAYDEDLLIDAQGFLQYARFLTLEHMMGVLSHELAHIKRFRESFNTIGLNVPLLCFPKKVFKGASKKEQQEIRVRETKMIINSLLDVHDNMLLSDFLAECYIKFRLAAMFFEGIKAISAGANSFTMKFKISLPGGLADLVSVSHTASHFKLIDYELMFQNYIKKAFGKNADQEIRSILDHAMERVEVGKNPIPVYEDIKVDLEEKLGQVEKLEREISGKVTKISSTEHAYEF